MWWRIPLKAAADAAGKAATLVVTVAAARTLGGDAFGVLALGMTTGWLLGVATDAGLSMHLARETARDPDRARAIAVEVMTVRGAMAYIAAALVTLLGSRVVPDPFRLAFVLIVLAQLGGAVLDTLAHLFRGLGRSEIESAVHLAQRGLTASLALVVLWQWPRLDYLGVALVAPPLGALVIALAIASLLTSGGEDRAADADGPTSSAMRLTWRRFARDVLPIGAATLISALYFRCDVYFVERWEGLNAAGGYNAVFRLVEAARLLPAAVMAVTFPALCRASTTGPVRRLGAGLLAAGLLGLAALVAGASPIVEHTYGETVAPAVPALRVLALALPLFFLNYALTHQVIGWDGHRAYLGIATAALAANLAANLLLVPVYGMVGAASSTILTEIVVTAGCLHVLRTARPTFGSVEPAAEAI
ncbi:MAG: oligosaccharide flippase family protein [Acidobacteriota bacterium]|nr:oligosaccharide flippase family protein [Acidobacteriota bacterium]